MEQNRVKQPNNAILPRDLCYFAALLAVLVLAAMLFVPLLSKDASNADAVALPELAVTDLETMSAAKSADVSEQVAPFVTSSCSGAYAALTDKETASAYVAARAERLVKAKYLLRSLCTWASMLCVLTCGVLSACKKERLGAPFLGISFLLYVLAVAWYLWDVPRIPNVGFYVTVVLYALTCIMIFLLKPRTKKSAA